LQITLVTSTARVDPKADNGFLDRCPVSLVMLLTCGFAGSPFSVVLVIVGQ